MSLLFQELVRRGIPHHFRGIAWQLLCNAHESKDKPKYAEYIRTQSACEKVKGFEYRTSELQDPLNCPLLLIPYSGHDLNNGHI